MPTSAPDLPLQDGPARSGGKESGLTGAKLPTPSCPAEPSGRAKRDVDGPLPCGSPRRGSGGADPCHDGLDDTPPGEFDAGYWWPKSAGYDRALARSTYPPVGAWQTIRSALESTGMTGDEAARVMGGNMLRVARQVWRV